MSNVNGPRHAKQLLTNARGMTRRVQDWMLEVGYPFTPLTKNLEIAIHNLTKALEIIDPHAKEQQAAERSQRESVRNR